MSKRKYHREKPDDPTTRQSQELSTRYGICLTDGQIYAYNKYRQDAAFNGNTDKELLYMVVTPHQREKLDGNHGSTA